MVEVGRNGEEWDRVEKSGRNGIKMSWKECHDSRSRNHPTKRTSSKWDDFSLSVAVMQGGGLFSF